MYVPSFVPQPIEIPDNVAEAPYAVRLGFVRRVAGMHFLSVLLVAGMAALPVPPLPPAQAALAVLTMMIVLSVVRGLAKGRLADVRLSTFLLPLGIFTVALWMRSLFEAGWAVWAIGVGIACAVAYTLACGRDLSFVGMFVIALASSTMIVLYLGYRSALDSMVIASALCLNGAFLFYYVYDLAALLTRRRLGEEWGAVADLYRDVLNGITYPIRVFQHWRDHRIWTAR